MFFYHNKKEKPAQLFLYNYKVQILILNVWNYSSSSVLTLLNSFFQPLLE